LRLARISLALALALAPIGIAHAATVNALQGQVLVNSGQGYRLVDGSTQLEPGGTVVANPGAVAQVVYGSSCTITVQPGSVYLVAASAPCQAGQPTPSAGTPASTAAAPSGGGSSTTLWVVGGIAVAGGAGAYFLLQSLSP
jgi:hypothetical protein